MTRIPTMAGVVPVALMLALLCGASTPTLAQPADDSPDQAGTGLVFEPEAVYRGFPALGTYRAFLPPVVDLSRHMPPVGSQGSQSSCVGWATSYGLRSYYENRRRGGPSGAPTLSPSFVYNQIKDRRANCEVGSSISDALNLMKRLGTVPMSEFPYDPSSCTRLPEPEIASEASSLRIRDWKRVDVSRLDDVKGQLFAGNPVVIGMLVNQGFHKLRGDDIYDDAERTGGGHAMVVVGYDDNRNAFRLFNSWGRKWGNGGLGWVDYATFQVRTRSAFVMEVAAGAAPEPEPPAPVHKVTPTPTPTPRPAPAHQPPAPRISIPPSPVPQGHIPFGPPVTHAPAPVPTPAPAPVTVTPAPRVPPPQTPIAPISESQLNTQLADIPCSVLRAERGAEGRLAVRGVVGKTADRDRILELLRAAGGGGPSLDVAVMPWPQCEVRMTFAPALARSAGLSIRVRPATGTTTSGASPVLVDGAPLVLEVSMPTFSAYLYVIYLQVGGEAVYLHTPAMANGHPWPASSRVVIGDGEGGSPALTVSDPFGDEMILAVASPFPLTTAELPTTMTEREFLSLFRKALLGHGTRGVTLMSADQAAASYTLLTTRPR